MLMETFTINVVLNCYTIILKFTKILEIGCNWFLENACNYWKISIINNIEILPFIEFFNLTFWNILALLSCLVITVSYFSVLARSCAARWVRARDWSAVSAWRARSSFNRILSWAQFSSLCRSCWRNFSTSDVASSAASLYRAQST